MDNLNKNKFKKIIKIGKNKNDNDNDIDNISIYQKNEKEENNFKIKKSYLIDQLNISNDNKNTKLICFLKNTINSELFKKSK